MGAFATIMFLQVFLLSLLINGLLVYVAVSIVHKKASFFRAVLAVLCGSVLFSIIPPLGLLTALIALFLWLLLLKEFFGMSWEKAVIAAILVVVVNIAFAVILGMIGFAVFSVLPQYY
jgi:hypothetical protein